MEFYIRAYSRHSKEVWAKTQPLKDGITDSFNLSFRSSGGGVSGEIKIDCSILAGKEVFKVKSFSDSIKCLLGFSDILMQLECLYESENIADKIEEVLIKNNIVLWSELPTYMELR